MFEGYNYNEGSRDLDENKTAKQIKRFVFSNVRVKIKSWHRKHSKRWVTKGKKDTVGGRRTHREAIWVSEVRVNLVGWRTEH